jgi:hypothetical protein
VKEQEEKNRFQVFLLNVAVSNDRTEERKKREDRMKDNRSRRPILFSFAFLFFFPFCFCMLVDRDIVVV